MTKKGANKANEDVFAIDDIAASGGGLPKVVVLNKVEPSPTGQDTPDNLYSLHLKSHGEELPFDSSSIARRIGDYFIAQISESASTVMDETIQALVQSREFLGLQLDHAKGNITDEQFESFVETYLKEKQPSDPAILAEKIKILYSILSKPLDSEILSMVFNCELDEVEAAIQKLLQDVKQG